MSADDKRTENINGLPKTLVVPFVVGLIGTILLCALMLFSQRARFDPTVYKWGAILIAGMFALSIPVALLQRRLKERARSNPPFRPWPQSVGNPHFGDPLPMSDLRLAGQFNWTPDAFVHLAKDWRRNTPAGRHYRRTMLGLTSLGLAGIALAAIFLWQREWSAIALIVASGLLLLLAYDCRIRTPREVHSRNQVRWQLLPERFVLISEEDEKVIEWSGVQAVLQTPAGFLLWPHDFIEVCLPTRAFANRSELDLFAAVAQSKVQNFVRVD